MRAKVTLNVTSVVLMAWWIETLPRKPGVRGSIPGIGDFFHACVKGIFHRHGIIIWK